MLENHSGPGDAEEEKMKGKLNFFFLNPIDKYLASKRLPWILLVTAQLLIIASNLVVFDIAKLSLSPNSTKFG